MGNLLFYLVNLFIQYLTLGLSAPTLFLFWIIVLMD